MSLIEITAANSAALVDGVVRPILFMRAAFASGVKRFHTEIGPKSATHPIYGSESYTGVGDFGGITSSISESVSSAPQAVQIALTGVDSTLIADVLDSSDYHRRELELMLGLDDESGDLIADPMIVWGGYMDKVDIVFARRRADVVLTCESRASIGRQASDLRFTDEQLQADYSGDLAAEYVFRMTDIKLKLGGERVEGSTSRRGFASSGGFRGVRD